MLVLASPTLDSLSSWGRGFHYDAVVPCLALSSYGADPLWSPRCTLFQGTRNDCSHCRSPRGLLCRSLWGAACTRVGLGKYCSCRRIALASCNTCSTFAAVACEVPGTGHVSLEFATSFVTGKQSRRGVWK